MRNRSLAAATVLALLLAACSNGASEDPTASTDGPDATTTTAAAVAEEVLLSYDLAAGDTFVYEVELEQRIDMTSEGEGASFSEEDLPGQASVDISASGTFTFLIADGPEEGTYEVTITGELTDVTASGEVDGEPITGDEIPDFAEIAPVETTIVVDEQGNVIDDGSGSGDPFGDMFGGMGEMAPGSIPGAELGQFFGPPFGAEEVTVGDTWSTSFDVPGLGDDPITTTISSEVTGVDTVNGSDVFVIDSATTVEAFEFDLGEFLIGFITGFAPENPTDEEQAEMDALVENLRFVMSFDETASDSTTYFDVEAGLTRRFDVTSSSSIGMDVVFPDETTGELSGFVMNMTIEQTVGHELVSGPTA